MTLVAAFDWCIGCRSTRAAVDLSTEVDGAGLDESAADDERGWKKSVMGLWERGASFLLFAGAIATDSRRRVERVAWSEAKRESGLCGCCPVDALTRL